MTESLLQLDYHLSISTCAFLAGRRGSSEGVMQVSVADLVANQTSSRIRQSHDYQLTMPVEFSRLSSNGLSAPGKASSAHKQIIPTQSPSKRLSIPSSSSSSHKELQISASSSVQPMSNGNGIQSKAITSVPNANLSESSRPKLRATRTQDQMQSQSPADSVPRVCSSGIHLVDSVQSRAQLSSSNSGRIGTSNLQSTAPAAEHCLPVYAFLTHTHPHARRTLPPQELEQVYQQQANARPVRTAHAPGSGISSGQAWTAGGASNMFMNYFWLPAQDALKHPVSEEALYRQLLEKTGNPAAVNANGPFNASPSSFTYPEHLPIAPSNLTEAFNVSGDSPRVAKGAAGSAPYPRRLIAVPSSSQNCSGADVNDFIDLDTYAEPLNDLANSYSLTASVSTPRAADLQAIRGLSTPTPIRGQSHVAHTSSNLNPNSNAPDAFGVSTRAMAQRADASHVQKQLHQTVYPHQQQAASRSRNTSGSGVAKATPSRAATTSTLSEPRFRAQYIASKVAQGEWLENGCAFRPPLPFCFSMHCTHCT